MLFNLIIYCYFLTIGQLDYVLPLRVGFSCHFIDVLFSFFMLYSYLKRMKHFLIPVSVSKADYRRKVEIVIFIAAKTL